MKKERAINYYVLNSFFFDNGSGFMFTYVCVLWWKTVGVCCWLFYFSQTLTLVLFLSCIVVVVSPVGDIGAGESKRRREKSNKIYTSILFAMTFRCVRFFFVSEGWIKFKINKWKWNERVTSLYSICVIGKKNLHQIYTHRMVDDFFDAAFTSTNRFEGISNMKKKLPLQSV